MKKNHFALSVTFFFLAFALACSNSSVNSNQAAKQANTNSSTRSNANSLANIPTQNLMPKKGTEEKTFSFTDQDNEHVTAYVYANPKKIEGKMIVFEPLPGGTDGNLYTAALNSLRVIYGKERGVFQLEDAKSEFDSDLGGNAICWNIENSKQRFCVLPIKDAKKGEIISLHVWITGISV